MSPPVRTVVLREELRVDLIAKRYMGTERAGMVEALLLANPGLSAGAFVPGGTKLRIPIIAPVPKRVAAIYPWE